MRELDIVIENVWKWFLRLMLTVVLLLVISILSLVTVNVPKVFDTVYEIADVAQSVEKASKSLTKTSERAYEVLEENSNQQ